MGTSLRDGTLAAECWLIEGDGRAWILLCAVIALVVLPNPMSFGDMTDGSSWPAFGFALSGLPAGPDLRSVQKATGVRPRLVLFYLQWPPDPKDRSFPEPALRSIDASGAIPILSWEPMFSDPEQREHVITAGSIVTGNYDSYLKGFAGECRQFGKPFLIRFAHEMNLARYHWGGDSQDFGPASGGKYQAMFRHIVEIFRSEKVTNVSWVFCPNADSVPAEPWNKIASYYPGDDVVDVIGLDGYNWGTTQTRAVNGWESQWRSFESIFATPLQELRQIAFNKPSAIFETSSATAGGNKEAWIQDALNFAKANGLGALVWFELNKELDWRLETDVSSALRDLINRESAPSSSVWPVLHR
jgi:mannan endo-1,4-beta-mannosidase